MAALDTIELVNKRADPVAVPAETLLETKAIEIMKRDPKITKADADLMALNQNPELYKQYEVEKRKQVGG